MSCKEGDLAAFDLSQEVLVNRPKHLRYTVLVYALYPSEVGQPCKAEVCAVKFQEMLPWIVIFKCPIAIPLTSGNLWRLFSLFEPPIDVHPCSTACQIPLDQQHKLIRDGYSLILKSEALWSSG